jgi:Ca-activated chloride channel homolog
MPNAATLGISILALFLFSIQAATLDGRTQTAGQGYEVKVDVDLVATDVTVIGSPASELKVEDFLIYDNDVTQPITYFSHGQLPLAVALVVDVSRSIAPYLPSLQIAAVSALRQLKPEDQVALFSFAGDHWKNSDLTQDRDLIAEKIGKFIIKTKCGCETNIYDTIYDAARYLKKAAPRRRRAIILISDNCQADQAKHGPDVCLTELLETGTTLYSIRTPGDIPSYCFESQPAIKKMAEETGSEVLDVIAPTSLKTALETAVTNIRMQYTIGFNTPNRGDRKSFHRLAVKFTKQDRCPECRILARKGYYAGGPAPVIPKEETMNARQPSSPKEIDDLLVQKNILIAGTGHQDIKDIAFNASTVEQKDAGGKPQVLISLQIFPEKINFKSEKDHHACNLRAVIFYADEKGNILGSDSRKIEGLLSQETYDKSLKSGISFSTAIPLKSPNQILKIVVYDEANDMAGSQLIRLHNK